MRSATTSQIVARSYFWIFIFSTDTLAIDLLNALPKKIQESYWLYLAMLGIAVVTFLLTFRFRADSLSHDIREICLYDIFLQGVGLFSYIFLHYNNQIIFNGLTYAIIFMKFGRIFWPLRTSNGEKFSDWPKFGILGFLSKTTLEETAQPNARKTYCFLLFCIICGLTVTYFDLKLHYSFFIFAGLIGVLVFYNSTIIEIEEQEERIIQTERYAAAQEVRAEMAVQHAKEQGILHQQIAYQNIRLKKINNALRDTAHDLRSPMSRIQQETAQLLRADTHEKRIHAGLNLENAVVKFSQELDDTIKDAMLATGISQPKIQAVRIDRLLNKVHQEWCDTAIDQGFKAFNLYPIPGTRMMVATDARIILRILRNLVNNAIAHGVPDTGLALSLRRRGQMCLVRVWDTGPGIPDADSPDRYVNFQRFLEKVRTEGKNRNGNGHGLGLSIVSNLADVLGLHIELRSRIGRGTIFGFSLMLADDELIMETERMEAKEQAVLKEMLN